MTTPELLGGFNPYLGVFTQFCVPNQTTLVLKEKVFSLSGDTFSVKDANGAVVVNCQGKTFSLTDRKEFTDPAGRPLFSLRTKLLSIHKTFEAEGPDGNILFTVKSKFSFGGAKMIVTFINTIDRQPIELLIEGDWFDRSAKITLNNRMVAQIGRNFFNMGQIFGGQQTYQVSVAAGVDLAMMAAICICLDEKENEK